MNEAIRENRFMPERGAHHLFLVWLMFVGLAAFAFFVSWHMEWLQLVFIWDSSRISWVIAILFLVICVHAAARAYVVSTEITRVAIIGKRIARLQPGGITIREGRLIAGGEPLPDSVVTGYLDDLFGSPHPVLNAGDPGATNAELLEVVRHRLKGPNELGWYASDVMIRLGLLGTVVGFVLMLASVVGVTEFDAETMQGVLQKMGTGMGTALYTTVAGLVCSMFTTAQYYLLDQGADEVVEAARHLAQARIAGLLRQGGDG